MRWVNLITVNDYHEAHILTSELEQEDILSMQANEITATMLPHLRQGITIRVKESDLSKASEIAARVDAMLRTHCPNCGSNDLQYQGAETSEIRILERVILFLLLDFPSQRSALIYTCKKCATTFKVK